MSNTSYTLAVQADVALANSNAPVRSPFRQPM
jgi:hypothetical protein